MKTSKFLIFISVIVAAVWSLPEQMLDKEMLYQKILDKKIDIVSAPVPISTSKAIAETPKYKDGDPHKLIYDALKNLKSQVYLPTSLTSDEIFDIRSKVLEDNPEFFYLDYSNSRYWSNGKLEFNYINTKENIMAQSAEIDAMADAIIAKIIKPGMSEAKKELVIHNYIVNNINRASHNVDGILLDGVGVCEGYAKTFKLLLGKAGIESMIVVAPEINHAWNIVKIDGEYYHVDVTWDDPVPDVEGRVLHTFFNVSDKKMKEGKHVWDQSKYPACTSDRYLFMQYK